LNGPLGKQLIAKFIANHSEALGLQKRLMPKNWALPLTTDARWGQKIHYLAVC
jgi:hypothetical protein